MFLLDTHTLLWFLYNDGNLPKTVLDKIAEAPVVYTSIASVWEIAIKQSIGKLNISSTPSEIASGCRDSDIAILPIRPSHLDALKELPAIHKDPFDRLIIAQAREEGLVVVTRDSTIPKYPVETF